jgi:hypothetical protein
VEWLKVGNWILNVDDIAAVHYADDNGPAVEVFTRSGWNSPQSQKGSFSATGDEARALWAWWTERAMDVLAEPSGPPHRRVKVVE